MSKSDDILTRSAPQDAIRHAYGPQEYQFGDLRLPDGPGRHPVVIAIHGGYYRSTYGLEYMGHVCAALTAAGFATWNIEYRRLGNTGGGWPGTFEDVAAAADAVGHLAVLYPFDPKRTIVLGHSAGGHFACWLAVRHLLEPTQPLSTDAPLWLTGVVSLAGVLDLRRAWELRLSSGVVRELMGGTPEQYPERYAAASPIELLPLGVPQYLIHGTKDSSVPYEISARYAAVAKEKGEQVELITLDNVGHFEIVDPQASEWQSVLPVVRKAADAL